MAARLLIEVVENERKTGIRLTFEGQGPGVADLGFGFMTEGYTSGHGMGLGLTGAKKLSHEFEIWSQPGEGTRVSILRWR